MSHIVDLVKRDAFEPARHPPFWKRRNVVVAAAIILLLGIGLLLHRETADGTPVAVAQPPIPVTVAAVEPRSVRLWSEFSGRLTAVDSAEVRPQVSGRITEIRFRDGQQVQAGDALFVIDPRPYEAAVAKAQADLATAENNARPARGELGPASQLMKAQAGAREFSAQRAHPRGG